MRLSRSAGYAIQAILQLAQGEGKSPVSSQLLAAENDMPVRFLLTILSKLVKRGILKSRRGTIGGYLLARPAEDITLLELIEAVDGPVTDVWIQPIVRGQRNGHGHKGASQSASATSADSPNSSSGRINGNERSYNGRGFVAVVPAERRNGSANGREVVPSMGRQVRGAFVKLTDAARELFDSITVLSLVQATRDSAGDLTVALEKLRRDAPGGEARYSDAKNWVI
jgi:Rrf2 family protein